LGIDGGGAAAVAGAGADVFVEVDDDDDGKEEEEELEGDEADEGVEDNVFRTRNRIVACWARTLNNERSR
jgi:hypothetical protein